MPLAYEQISGFTSFSNLSNHWTCGWRLHFGPEHPWALCFLRTADFQVGLWVQPQRNSDSRRHPAL